MRKTLIYTAAACALTLVACSGRSELVETAVGEAEPETQEASYKEDQDYEDNESADYEGIISSIDGSVITLTGDDGSSLSFDISQAEVYDEESPVLTGSYCEVDYYVSDTDVYTAETFIVLNDIEQQADLEGRDPVIYGTLQLKDTNELQILDEAGYERSFDNQMSREVSFSAIKTGDKVAVTYFGYLLDGGSGTPYSIKIVALDALESEEGEANYITGTISDIYADGLELFAQAPTLDVECDPSLLEGLEEGDQIKLYYSGQLADIAVHAVKIEKID